MCEAISCLSLEKLVYLNGKKEKDKNQEVHEKKEVKIIQKIAGKKNEKKNNAFIHDPADPLSAPSMAIKP